MHIKKYKKIFFSFVFLSLLIFSAGWGVSLAQAGDYGLEKAAEGMPNGPNSAGNPSSDIRAMVGKYLNIALSFLGIIFFLIMIYAGFNWMIARGEKGAAEKAREMIFNAVMGLAIVVSAYVIVNFIGNALNQ